MYMLNMYVSRGRVEWSSSRCECKCSLAITSCVLCGANERTDYCRNSSCALVPGAKLGLHGDASQQSARGFRVRSSIFPSTHAFLSSAYFSCPSLPFIFSINPFGRRTLSRRSDEFPGSLQQNRIRGDLLTAWKLFTHKWT